MLGGNVLFRLLFFSVLIVFYIPGHIPACFGKKKNEKYKFFAKAVCGQLFFALRSGRK